MSASLIASLPLITTTNLCEKCKQEHKQVAGSVDKSIVKKSGILYGIYKHEHLKELSDRKLVLNSVGAAT